MAINIKFDLSGNPELPTIILANRNGNKLGQLKINADSVNLIDKFNDTSELSFIVNKYIDGELTPLWDKLVDFKLVWCKEWDMWFEIKVELDEETETVKTVLCTQLGQAELSQIMLYNIEINTEDDIARDDYKISILWDKNNSKSSILDRLLEKAPHYSIIHVDDTIKNIQRSFSFDGTSIHDAFQEIAEEIGCLFVYHSNSGENGKIQRTISVYDLQQNCLNQDCKYRGEFTDKCPKCGGTNIKQGYGEDTLIFVTADQLATEGIELATDTDSVKNCFKLEGGDDLMTATIRNCNPNGTDYLWYFSDAVKEDMSKELVDGINGYNAKYNEYYNDYISELNADLVSQYNALVENYKKYYNTKSTCINCKHEDYFEGDCPSCGSSNVLSGKTLQTIPTTIKGYSNLMNAYYNTIDLALYLQSGLMPSIVMSDTNAQEQADLLTASSLSPVAVNNEKIESVSLATANSAVLSMAKIIVRSTYKVEVGNSNYDKDTHVWSGNFVITNYSDENDTAESQTIEVIVNNDTETFVRQKLDKALNKEDTDDYSISGLFEKEYEDFRKELKKYALNPLKSFYDSCDACINILIDSGAGNKDEKPDLYDGLYEPYYKKSSAISDEIKTREEEIAIIEGVWDKTTDEKNPELVTKGLQQYIEKCRNEIQDALDFEKYLGEELWLEFCAYRREDTYSNDNYISDGLNNAQLFERALEFYDVAENEIYKSAELQHSISTSLNNLLAIDKFKPLVDSFNVGNWIRIQVDDRIFKLRLLEYEIDFGSFENISVEFSDVTKVKNGVTDVRSVIEQASSMATNYSSIQRQADKGNKAKDVVEQWTTDGLNAALVQIQNNNNEEVTMTKGGLLARSFDDITGEYLPEQLRITHNIMAYTDDNWQTVKQAIGKHNYKAFDEGSGELTDKTGYGMSAEFVTAGVVSGSQIIGGDIYSNNYSKTKETGSYINLEDGTFSFAGGSLRYDGGDLIISSPDVVTKNEVTTINENYLKTTTVYAQNLQVGAANIQGTITAQKLDCGEGSIGGWLIEPNYIGLEKWDEEDSSNNVAMSSTGVNAYVSALGGYNTCLLYFKDKFAVLEDGTMCASDANIEGKITATSGFIGDWEISGSSIQNFCYTTDNNLNWISLMCPTAIGSSGVGTDVFVFRTFDGSEWDDNNYTDNLRINSDGTLTANKLIATGGVVGGWEIIDNVLKNGAIGEDGSAFMSTGTNDSLTLGGHIGTDWVFGAGNAFGVNASGKMYCTGGRIGGWFIGSDYLQSGTGDENIYIRSSIADDGKAIRIYNASNVIPDVDSTGNYDFFYVTYDGRFYASSGNINNAIKINSAGTYPVFLGSTNGRFNGTWSTSQSISVTSDVNQKNTISDMNDMYDIFFDNLRGRTFKYNYGTSGRLHTGFIAQEVKDALDVATIDTHDFAGLTIYNNDDTQEWSLRYEEFIALNTWQIQKLKSRVLELEEKIKVLEQN